MRLSVGMNVLQCLRSGGASSLLQQQFLVASFSSSVRMNPLFLSAHDLVSTASSGSSASASPAAPKGASPASSTSSSSALPEIVAPPRASPPFARPQSTGLRLVARVAERATERTRLSLADRSLDKEASITTGTITPGRIGDTDAEVGGSSGADGNRKNRVQPESLARIERYMGQGKSPAARAAVHAVLGKKASEFTAGSPTDPIAQLAALAAKAEAEGIRLLLSREERALLKDWRKTHGTRPASPRIQGPGYDAVAAAATLAPLAPETKRMKTYVDRNREDLSDAAKAVRFPMARFAALQQQAKTAGAKPAAAAPAAAAPAPVAAAPADAAAAPAPAA
jgi:hypothetical protein